MSQQVRRIRMFTTPCSMSKTWFSIMSNTNLTYNRFKKTKYQKRNYSPKRHYIKMTSKSRVLNLYKVMLKESQKIPAYNFRKYAIRRVQDGFKANKFQKDLNTIRMQILEAEKNLEIIKRQAIIGHLYDSEKLVIEHQPK